MPDITMCDGVNALGICLKRNDCYRHTAHANEWRQSYFTEAPFKIVTVQGLPSQSIAQVQECKYFGSNRELSRRDKP